MRQALLLEGSLRRQPVVVENAGGAGEPLGRAAGGQEGEMGGGGRGQGCIIRTAEERGGGRQELACWLQHSQPTCQLQRIQIPEPQQVSQGLVPSSHGDGCVSLGGDATGEVWVVEPRVADQTHERDRGVDAGDLTNGQENGLVGESKHTSKQLRNGVIRNDPRELQGTVNR